jgi:6-phosphogluconolactonase
MGINAQLYRRDPSARSVSFDSDDTTMDVELGVEGSAAEASRTVAGLLVEAARAGAGIVLAGGTTPREAFRLAAEAEPDWGRAEVWLGDERVVPPDDPRSNGRLVREALLDRLAVTPAVHFVRTELPADEAAAAYDRELRGARLDFALLGLGPDGHTASLFPNAPALDERERLAVAAKPGLDPWVDRVTMTLPALTSPAQVVFMVVGQEKAEAVRRAFTEPPSPAIPASLVRSASGRTTVILDRAAASELS